MTTLTRLDLDRLAPFHAAGVLAVPDVQVAAALMRIGGHGLIDIDDAAVALGAALCVRALRAGSVCVDLTADPGIWLPEAEVAPLPWPEASTWVAAVSQHPLVAAGADAPADRPLRLVGDLLYLQRYWCDEQVIRACLRERAQELDADLDLVATALARLFPGADRDRQRLAAATVVMRQMTILAGGPGTGKTTTVARILALLREAVSPGLSIALAAPTGKAAARLEEAVAGALGALSEADRARVGTVSASTLHRLLGWKPGSKGRFHHDRSNPLPHDVVVVDETSMVSLPMMARLLEAVRPDARLVLVGDPDQLESIDAGAVLGDLVAIAPDGSHESLASDLARLCPREAEDTPAAAATGVVVLDRNYRFTGAIADLAAAIRRGDADTAMQVLTAGHADVEFVSSPAAARPEIVEQTGDLVAAARDGDAHRALAVLENHRVLCAHREGPYGVSHWDDLMREWTEHLISGASPGDPWYVGRPLLVTANDYAAGLFNGDTGVVIATTDGPRAAFRRGTGLVELPVSRLDTVSTLRAMTIHRGQGSQFDAVTVVLPKPSSALLTRELLYTAVTRARTRIRVIGGEDAVRAGILRQVRRASGLA